MNMITISSKGQITLPATIRRKLNLGMSNQLSVKEHEGKIILQKVDYWTDFNSAQQSIQLALKSKKVQPLTNAEIKNLRNQTWSDKIHK